MKEFLKMQTRFIFLKEFEKKVENKLKNLIFNLTLKVNQNRINL